MSIPPSWLTNPIKRRAFVGNAGKLVLAFILYDTLLRPLIQQPLEPTLIDKNRPVRFGATFSQVKTHYMDMDYKEAFRELLSLDLDFVRLCSYWSEIEPKKGQIANFQALDWLLNESERRGRPEVILTAGIKAPVFPEFHLPAWAWEEIDMPKVGAVTGSPLLREYALRFIREVMERYGNAGIVKRIQVENEPFDPVLYDFATYRFLGVDFLREEIALVRAIDPLRRPILLNTFVETSPLTNVLANVEGNPLIQLITRSLIGRWERAEVVKLADIVGYDVYASVGWELLGRKFYMRPWRDGDYNNLVVWREQAELAGKPAIITEAQAEPWEPGSVAHMAKRDFPSFNPDAMEQFIDRLVSLGFRDICLWGVEHWLWHRRAGHPEWWNKGVEILSKYR